MKFKSQFTIIAIVIAMIAPGIGISSAFGAAVDKTNSVAFDVVAEEPPLFNESYTTVLYSEVRNGAGCIQAVATVTPQDMNKPVILRSVPAASEPNAYCVEILLPIFRVIGKGAKYFCVKSSDKEKFLKKHNFEVCE